MVVIMLGPPGVGKGTQSKLLASRKGFKHLSTGDAFRSAIQNKTDLGKKVDSILKAGQLVPDDLTCALVESVLGSPDYKGKGVILDGFPRTAYQAECFDEILRKLGAQVDHVVNIEVDREEIVQRLVKRGQETGRADDTREVIVTRFQVYEEQTAPLISYYGKRKLLRVVNGMGTLEEVFGRIESAIK
jgi:adenylate kinase